MCQILHCFGKSDSFSKLSSPLGRLPREILPQQHMNDNPIHSCWQVVYPQQDIVQAERNGLTPMTPCVECDNRMLTERTAVKDHTMCIGDRTHQNRPITESRLVAGWGKIHGTANRPELSLGVIRMFWS